MSDHAGIKMPSLTTRIGRERLDALTDPSLDESRIKAIRDEVNDVIAEHLAHLRSIGIVRPHTSLANRRINLIHSWNVMCGTVQDPYSDQDQETRQIALRLGRSLLFYNMHSIRWAVKRDGIDAAERERRMAEAMAKIDSGDIPWWTMSSQETDHVTGETLNVEFRDWNPVLGIVEGRNQHMTPAVDVEPVRLHEIEIDMPTGDLLFADWFRPDGFTNLVDEGNPWRGGSQKENEADAERYVRDHGFASVCSIRRSLGIFTDGRRITVGRHDEDGDRPVPKGFRRKADLFIDLRKVSIVDRASLLATLSRIHDPETAARLTEEASRADGVRRMKVEPGRYRVTSSGRGYIEDLLADGDPLKADGYEPVLVMERVD